MACGIANSSLLFMHNRRPVRGNANPTRTFPANAVGTTTTTHCLKWGRLHRSGFQHRPSLSSRSVANADVSATDNAAAFTLDSAEYRKQLSESYGFRQIGEPLPPDVTMKNILDTLPKEVFEIDDVKAWKAVLTSISSFALGILMISKAPWYLLPLAWAWTGTAATGVSGLVHSFNLVYLFNLSFQVHSTIAIHLKTLCQLRFLIHFSNVKFFVIGHDCAHKSFSRNKLVEDIVGTLAFMPLIYPYEPWRFKHDRHHAKTNMLIEDTAWQPVYRREFDSVPVLRKGIVYGYGPFRPWMSIAHWLIWHFDLKKFRPNEVKRVTISLASVFAFMAIGWPLIIYKAGILGLIKFWLMPWLGYHFWMSTFTMVHHTAPHIPFKSSEEWNAAQAQLNGTVHCDYPQWIETLCHHINVHIPHHISPKIPNYNLRAAHQSLQKNWGKYLNEATWNWRLMKTIMTMCHLYDKERNYVPFDEVVPGESKPIVFLRKVMPNYA